VSLLSLMHGSQANYRVKNERLLIPTRWMFNKEVFSAIEEDTYNILNTPKDSGKLNPSDLSSLKYTKFECSDVYSIPLFNEEFISLINNEITNIKPWFSVNEDEPENARIQEFVLSTKCPSWHLCMLQVTLKYINAIFYSLFGRFVSDGTIQIANYNPKEITKTAWHHDQDSSITMVVPLNTGEYKGGGTEFYNRGIVEPLPSGHGLIFPAYSHVHRGLPVTNGDRYLLVFWMK